MKSGRIIIFRPCFVVPLTVNNCYCCCRFYERSHRLQYSTNVTVIPNLGLTVKRNLEIHGLSPFPLSVLVRYTVQSVACRHRPPGPCTTGTPQNPRHVPENTAKTSGAERQRATTNHDDDDWGRLPPTSSARGSGRHPRDSPRPPSPPSSGSPGRPWSGPPKRTSP